MTTFLTAAEAKPRLAEFDVIVDIRSQGEWDAGHLQLPSVRLVENLHQHPEKVAGLSDIYEKKVLVHCGSGRRARMAEPSMKDVFTNLFIVGNGGYGQLTDSANCSLN